MQGIYSANKRGGQFLCGQSFGWYEMVHLCKAADDYQDMLVLAAALLTDRQWRDIADQARNGTGRGWRNPWGADLEALVRKHIS